jgi:hypothetical protein
MSEQWYYGQDGRQIGPVSRQELDSLIQSGQVGQQTLVWRAGMVDWLPANLVPGLTHQDAHTL